MNCREAQELIFADRDGAPDNGRAALESHLAHCAGCRQVRANLAAALDDWRDAAEKVAVPDVEREWHAVRRRIRGGAQAGAVTTTPPRRQLFAWLALPLGAAAALALALYISPPRPDSTLPVLPLDVASAESVEAPGNNASTMVIVDDKSGWLIVWASDEQPKQG